MLLTEDEAKERKCPMAALGKNCVASLCMTWRFSQETGPVGYTVWSERGFCGFGGWPMPDPPEPPPGMSP